MSDRVVVVGGGVIGACCGVLPREGRASASRSSIAAGSGPRARTPTAATSAPATSSRSPRPARSGPRSRRSSSATRRSRSGPASCSRNLGWFLSFARRCNERDMLAAGRAIQALLNSSRTLFDELIRDEQTRVRVGDEGAALRLPDAEALRPLRPHRRTCSAASSTWCREAVRLRRTRCARTGAEARSWPAATCTRPTPTCGPTS